MFTVLFAVPVFVHVCVYSPSVWQTSHPITVHCGPCERILGQVVPAGPVHPPVFLPLHVHRPRARQDPVCEGRQSGQSRGEDALYMA